jgi:hypothetical protein
MVQKSVNRAISYFISSTLIGLSLGWIIGLSVSPILHIIVGSLMSLIVSIVSVLAGIKKDEEAGTKHEFFAISRINLWPVALVLVGTAIGASAGIYHRTNDSLGLNPQALLNKWEINQAKREEIKEELFRRYYLKDSINKPEQMTAGLFSLQLSSSDCDIIRLKHGDQLKGFLASLSIKRVDSLLNICSTDSCLEQIKIMICQKR